MKKIISIGILIILAVVLGSTYAYFHTSPSKTAQIASNPSQTVNCFEEDNKLIFAPKVKQEKLSVILYPGAFIDALSYAPLAKQLASNGYKTYIVDMPLNLAVFGKNQANEIIHTNNSENFVIGGHSLGGVMAARYAAEHQKNIHGVFFLASYPDQKADLSATNIPELSITATNDGVLNQRKYNENKSYMSKKRSFAVIQGGNHAGFGSYGKQHGDHKRTISASKQTDEVAEAMIVWLKKCEK